MKEKGEIYDSGYKELDNLRGLLGIRRLDRFPNAQVRELCQVMKGVDERIGEDILQWFGHMEGMENDEIKKCVCW